MKVALDGRELLGQPTGVGRLIAEWVARWSRDPELGGDTVYLYVPTGGAPVMPAAWIGEGGARVVVRAVGRRGDTLWQQTRVPLAAARDGVDLFFGAAYTGPLLVMCRLVVAIYDVSFFAHREWFRRHEGLVRRTLCRLSARRARHIVTISEFSRAEIRRYLGRAEARVTVIPVGGSRHPSLAVAPASGSRQVNRPQAAGRASDAPSASVVLFAGTMFARRHLPTLVRAFASVASDFPDAVLVLAGDSRMRGEEARQLATSLGVAARVEFRGYVTDAELEDLYRRARVFAFVSSYEGFGLTPLEAMQHGVPAIVGDTPTAHEAYGSAARYVTPGDVTALAAALRDLLPDSPARTGLLERQATLLAQYSWDNSARALWSVFAEAAR